MSLSPSVSCWPPSIPSMEDPELFQEGWVPQVALIMCFQPSLPMAGMHGSLLPDSSNLCQEGWWKPLDHFLCDHCSFYCYYYFHYFIVFFIIFSNISLWVCWLSIDFWKQWLLDFSIIDIGASSFSLSFYWPEPPV